MKLNQMLTLLVLTSILTYKAEAIRMGKVTLSASNHQGIIKISSVEGSSSQDHHSISKTPEFLSGIDRKLMTKNRSSSTKTSTKVGKEKSSEHWKKEIITKQYPDVIDIAGMDYSPARKKSPIHN